MNILTFFLNQLLGIPVKQEQIWDGNVLIPSLPVDAPCIVEYLANSEF